MDNYKYNTLQYSKVRLSNTLSIYGVYRGNWDSIILCDNDVLEADESYYSSNEEVTGCGQHMFLCVRDTLDILLGSPSILKNDTAYWPCRKQWLLYNKKNVLSQYSNMYRAEEVVRSPKLTFLSLIHI